MGTVVKMCRTAPLSVRYIASHRQVLISSFFLVYPCNTVPTHGGALEQAGETTTTLGGGALAPPLYTCCVGQRDVCQQARLTGYYHASIFISSSWKGHHKLHYTGLDSLRLDLHS